MPIVTYRCSPAEWSGSGTVSDKGSPNTVAASRKSTPCFARFDFALAESHSNVNVTPGG